MATCSSAGGSDSAGRRLSRSASIRAQQASRNSAADCKGLRALGRGVQTQVGEDRPALEQIDRARQLRVAPHAFLEALDRILGLGALLGLLRALGWGGLRLRL